MNRREFLQLATKTVGVVAVAAILPQVTKMADVVAEWPMVANADAIVDGGYIHDLEFSNMTLDFNNGVIVENCVFNNCQISLAGSSEKARVWFVNNRMYGSRVTVYDYSFVLGGYANSARVNTSFVGVRVLGDFSEYTAA